MPRGQWIDSSALFCHGRALKARAQRGIGGVEGGGGIAITVDGMGRAGTTGIKSVDKVPSNPSTEQGIEAR